MQIRLSALFAIPVATAFVAAAAAAADSAAEFYKGKQLTIVGSTDPGGAYDTMKDREFVAETNKAGLGVDGPLSGEALAAIVAKVAAPPAPPSPGSSRRSPPLRRGLDDGESR